MRRTSLPAIVLTLFLVLSGCLSPVTIERAGIQYDQAVTNVIVEQLLLNVARSRHHHPIHFTAISNVAATFDFRATAGGVPLLSGDKGPYVLPAFSGSVAENPTISIVPVEGELFTRRLLTPLDETKFNFLIRQEVDFSMLMRLMARAFRMDGAKGERVFHNAPAIREEYEGFRKYVLHLNALFEANQLHVGPIHYDKTWEVELNSAELLASVEKGLDVTQGSEKNRYLLRKREVGRVVITNYDPDLLSNEQRYELDQRASLFPVNQILVDIRPDYPGGAYPFSGRFEFRSFAGILTFIARGIVEEPEYHVAKDARTGEVRADPPKTLEVIESESAPSAAAYAIKYEGLHYSIKKPSSPDRTVAMWNMDAFHMMYHLFQMTVTDVSKVMVPSITIAK